VWEVSFSFLFSFCGPGDYLFGPVALGTDHKDVFFFFFLFCHPLFTLILFHYDEQMFEEIS